MAVERIQIAGKEQPVELVRHGRATGDQLVKLSETLGGAFHSGGFLAGAREAHDVAVDLRRTERSIGLDLECEALV
jgi:hypothetical protein